MNLLYQLLGVDFLMNMTNRIQDEFNTYFILHSPSAVNKSLVDAHPGNRLSNDFIESQILTTQKKLHSWNAIGGRYLDLYNITKHLHALSCSKDGVHILYFCNYRALTTQWDFNWLVSSGVVSIYQNAAAGTASNATIYSGSHDSFYEVHEKH